MYGKFINVIVGPRAKLKLKELCWNAVKLRDSVEMFVAVEADAATAMEQMAKVFAKALDEQAQREPTAIIYSDGRARVGMYKVAPNADELEIGRMVEEMAGQIREELEKAGLSEYANRIQRNGKLLDGVGITCGAFVDVPAEKWIDYKHSKEACDDV